MTSCYRGVTLHGAPAALLWGCADPGLGWRVPAIASVTGLGLLMSSSLDKAGSPVAPAEGHFDYQALLALLTRSSPHPQPQRPRPMPTPGPCVPGCPSPAMPSPALLFTGGGSPLPAGLGHSFIHSFHRRSGSTCVCVQTGHSRTKRPVPMTPQPARTRWSTVPQKEGTGHTHL